MGSKEPVHALGKNTGFSASDPQTIQATQQSPTFIGLSSVLDRFPSCQRYQKLSESGKENLCPKGLLLQELGSVASGH